MRCVNAVRTNPQTFKSEFPCSSPWLSTISRSQRSALSANSKLESSAQRQANDMARYALSDMCVQLHCKEVTAWSGFCCQLLCAAMLSFNELCFLFSCRNSRIDHVGSDGSTVGQRIRDAGYTTFPQAENIAMGQTSAHQVSRHWL